MPRTAVKASALAARLEADAALGATGAAEAAADDAAGAATGAAVVAAGAGAATAAVVAAAGLQRRQRGPDNGTKLTRRSLRVRQRRVRQRRARQIRPQRGRMPALRWRWGSPRGVRSTGNSSRQT